VVLEQLLVFIRSRPSSVSIGLNTVRNVDHRTLKSPSRDVLWFKGVCWIHLAKVSNQWQAFMSRFQ
jgi:hypothetical protein